MHLGLQCTMSSIVRRLGMRVTLKHGTITVSADLDIFTEIAVFCGKFFFSKTNLGSIIHYTYTSYTCNKYFRLCVVSEELRLNEIGLFL